MASYANAKAEKKARAILRQFGLEVESVAPFRERFGNEFAAIVVSNPEYLATQWSQAEADGTYEREYGRVLEVLTDPRCPLVVAGEYTGRTDIRIYVAFKEA